MIIPINIIVDILLIIILLLILNRAFSFQSILVDISSHSKHKYKIDKKVPLSGGVFILVSILYFNFKYLVDSYLQTGNEQDYSFYFYFTYGQEEESF